MYVLLLNMMRNNAESITCVAYSEDPQRLVDFLCAEAVAPYVETFNEFNGDHQYRKVFRKDGPLEWYNPPMSPTPDDIGPFGHGIRRIESLAEWIANAERRYWERLSGARAM